MISACLAAFGIVLVGQAMPGEDASVRLRSVGVPYYYDYLASLDGPAGFLKLPMVRPGRDDPASIAQVVREHPGREWLVGNEPDQSDQDGGHMAELTALVEAIRDADPTAVLIGPNILSTSSLEPYRGLSFDIWGVHVYDLSQPLDDWPHPLWVTEFGGGSAEPADYVRHAVQSFRQADVERWFLFASDPIPQAWGHSSGNWITTYARDGHGGLTDTGKAYKEAAACTD